MEEIKQPNLGAVEILGEHATNPPTPRTVGDKVIGTDILTGEVKDWTVSGDEFRIKAQFEEYVRLGALKAIDEVDRIGMESQADKMRAAYAGEKGAGAYNWDGKYCRQSRADWPGTVYLFFLLLRRCHPEVELAQAEAIARENPKGVGMAIAWAQGNWKSPSPRTETGKNGQSRMSTNVSGGREFPPA